MERKKQYVVPRMRTMELEPQAKLLCDSGSNQYWCNDQPSADEWWKKND